MAQPYRLFIVTFDLSNTVAGDARYKDADEALGLHGELFKPVKQLRLLVTRSSPRVLKGSLDQRIGRAATIFITPLSALPAWRIHGAAKKREWVRFTEAVQRYGIDVAGMSSAAEGPP